MDRVRRRAGTGPIEFQARPYHAHTPFGRPMGTLADRARLRVA